VSKRGGPRADNLDTDLRWVVYPETRTGNRGAYELDWGCDHLPNPIVCGWDLEGINVGLQLNGNRIGAVDGDCNDECSFLVIILFRRIIFG
jgi:hypothetical protein